MSDADETELIAAEYVLGTLSAEERARVEATRATDTALEEAILAWHLRLLPLLDAVPDVAPPAHIYDQLAERLFPDPALRLRPIDGGLSATAARHLRRRLTYWRLATGSFAALAAGLAIVVGLDAVRRPAPLFVAVLRENADSPNVLVDFSTASRDMTVKPVGASAPQGKSLELWIIEPSLGAPRSLGLIEPGQYRTASLGAFDPAIVTKALFAVTIEAKGGAPDGKPTSAPVWTGHMVELTP